MVSIWGWFFSNRKPTLFLTAISRTLEYLRNYYQERAYITPNKCGNRRRPLKARLWHVKGSRVKKPVARSVTITNMSLSINLHLVWRNLFQVVGLCGILWSTTSCPRMWACILFIWWQLRAVQSMEQRTHWCTPLRSVEPAPTFGYVPAPFQLIFYRTTPRRMSRE